MTINWKKYVDKIYCVNYIFHKHRNKKFKEELERMDIIQSGLYEDIEQFPSILYNHLHNIFNDYTMMSKDDPNIIKNFNVTLGHYIAIKKAYLKGYNYILVLENDCRFLKDKNDIINTLENTIDIFKQFDGPAIYGGSMSTNSINGIDAGLKHNSLYTLFTKEKSMHYFIAGAAFNIYNRSAMKCFVDFIEGLNYAVIDQYQIIYPENTMLMLINKHICIQQDWIYLMYNTLNDYNMELPSIEELEKNRYLGKPLNRDCEKIYNDIKKEICI